MWKYWKSDTRDNKNKILASRKKTNIGIPKKGKTFARGKTSQVGISRDEKNIYNINSKTSNENGIQIPRISWNCVEYTRNLRLATWAHWIEPQKW